MDRRTQAAVNMRRRRRRFTLLWVAAAVIAISVLLWYEQIALLYVLATLGVTALLVVVALADFGEAQRAAPVAPFDDAAALAAGGGVMGQTTSRATASTMPRTGARRG